MKKGGGRRNCHKRKDAEITEKNVLGRQIAQKVFFRMNGIFFSGLLL
jgi:hypothetical protein